MDNGWIKLHRKLLDSAVNCLPSNQKWVMIVILLMANHAEKKWIWKGKEFKCAPGQFVTSLEHLSEATGESIRTVRTALKNLENLNFLTNESTKTGRLITVEKWGFYQDCYAETDKVIDKQPTNKRQTSDKQPTTNKNDKNDNNEKKVVGATAEVFEHFQKCGFQINGYTAQDLDELVTDYGETWLLEAMTRAKDRGKCSLSYVKGILKSWKTSGGMDSGKTAEQIEEEKKKEKEEKATIKKQRENEWLEYRNKGHDLDFFQYAKLKGWF